MTEVIDIIKKLLRLIAASIEWIGAYIGWKNSKSRQEDVFEIEYIKIKKARRNFC